MLRICCREASGFRRRRVSEFPRSSDGPSGTQHGTNLFSTRLNLYICVCCMHYSAATKRRPKFVWDWQCNVCGEYQLSFCIAPTGRCVVYRMRSISGVPLLAIFTWLKNIWL